MYRIAICDDDRVFLHQLSLDVVAIMKEHHLEQGVDYDIDQFDEVLTLQQKMQSDNGFYHLLLLDIELSTGNGMDLAREIRKQNISCSIVYITSHRDYIYDCFDTQPLWYLLKPIDLDKFKTILISDYHKNYMDTRLVIKIEGKSVAIPFHKIYAVESTQHRCRIWLAQGHYDWNGSLSALKPQLPIFSFCQSHNSYILNLSHVKEIRRSDALMDNEQLFPISRRYHDQALDRYFAYLKR